MAMWLALYRVSIISTDPNGMVVHRFIRQPVMSLSNVQRLEVVSAVMVSGSGSQLSTALARGRLRAYLLRSSISMH